VEDKEMLFRAVKDHDNHHLTDPSGMLMRLGQSAFNDPERRPSVDRAEMRGDAVATRQDDSDGVVQLQTSEVRGIPCATMDAKGQKTLLKHGIDVHHRPLPENHAHGQIEAAPEIASDGAWKRLKEALCRVAMKRGWVHRPASAREPA
jgi:hypothetical protein